MKTIYPSDSELLEKTKRAAEHEKTATLDLLRYLVQVDERRAYATLACSSLFEYVVKILGYSETQASERVNSVRLMRAIPEVESKIESGALSMTTASQVQRFLRQEKKVGNTLTQTASLQVIENCAGQSKRDVEKTLFSLASEESKMESAEKIRELGATHTELKFAISEATLQKLNELKNLIGNESLQSIFDQGLDSLLAQVKKKKGVVNTKKEIKTSSTIPGKFQTATQSATVTESTPVIKSTFPGKSNPPPTRFISIHVKREISMRSGNQCEFVNQATGARCQSKYKLELDHYPVLYSLGGQNHTDSLRHACFQHNQRFAMKQGLVKH